MKIRFSTHSHYVQNGELWISPPVPSRTVMPKWLEAPLSKNTKKFIDQVGQAFLDALSLGYMIPVPFDFEITQEGQCGMPVKIKEAVRPENWVHWTPFEGMHGASQFENAPWNAMTAPKLKGFWFITTPPGSSCLFTAPFARNSIDLPFLPLSGIVETDRYKNLIQFPVIPRTDPRHIRMMAGRPFVQVIPFSRSDWTAHIIASSEPPQKSEDDVIKFRCHPPFDLSRIAPPIPCRKKLPKWYQQHERFTKDASGKNTKTIKMCPPFLEALSHGYIVPAPEDLNLDEMAKHPIDPDLLKHSPWDGQEVFRIESPWVIDTPPGTSSLVITPPYREPAEAPFEILPEFIGSDTSSTLNPLVVTRHDAPRKIPKGTPLFQVVPMQRDEWQLETGLWNPEELNSIEKFRSAYLDPGNRIFEEGEGQSPSEGWGAYHKLVKVPTRFN